MSYVAARTGGLVSAASPTPVVVKMQEGGTAKPIRASNYNFEIKVQPKFMTGDRRAAKQTAIEIKRMLENLNVRWGS